MQLVDLRQTFQVQSAAQSALALALGVPSEALRQEAQLVPARQPGCAMTIMSNVRIQKTIPNNYNQVVVSKLFLCSSLFWGNDLI